MLGLVPLSAKNLSPHEFKQVGGQCALQREIFRIRPQFTAPAPVTCTDVFGCSENIAIGAQTKAGFVSKFDQGDWKNVYARLPSAWNSHEALRGTASGCISDPHAGFLERTQRWEPVRPSSSNVQTHRLYAARSRVTLLLPAG